MTSPESPTSPGEGTVDLAPCDWPYVACDPCEALTTLSAAEQTQIQDMATEMLWLATGRVYGSCPVTVLPCHEAWCGRCSFPLRVCGCRSTSEIKLDGLVFAITEVVIDGVVLDDTAYRVDDWQWLVRIDGGTWPTSTDPTDADAFAVSYLRGLPPPAGAGLMVGQLTCELAKSICNDETCRLPRRIRQVTRQGVRIDFDPGAGFGLPLVDSWVARVANPVVAGAVHSPDLPTMRRVTWQAS